MVVAQKKQPGAGDPLVSGRPFHPGLHGTSALWVPSCKTWENPPAKEGLFSTRVPTSTQMKRLHEDSKMFPGC
ncbi:hypothetical protein PFLUV_G00270120 [Perca fluviatilis]|uniref:Uncharacterized protein n=1 Tax=Perca fluviatilis TaxID=8168 RepID=A0A6A5DYP3_PERFL|nr:hypothetical protein PFLUV_G00270120 [Perca fluviatilis]